MEDFKVLEGKTIEKIFMNEEFLKFQTKEGNVVFSVAGDCCSQSVFYDFYGVDKLFGKKVKHIEEIYLKPSDLITKETEWGEEETDKKGYQESIKVYGFRITTEDKEFGDVSSVFSFRNYSNGYYGGWMDIDEDQEVLPEIFGDVLVTQPFEGE